MPQIPIVAEALKFDSMKDNGINRFNQPRLLLNCRYDGDVIVSRPPHRKVMDNSVSGNYQPVGGGEFVYNKLIYKIFAHPNGKLWVQKADGAAPVELTLGGGNAMHFPVKVVRTQQSLSGLYITAFYDDIAITTRKFLFYDGATDTVSDITTQLPAGVTQPIDVFEFANGMRLGVADYLGEIVVSKLNVVVATAVTPFDTSAGAMSFLVTKGNGLTIANIATSGGQLLISKQLVQHRRSSMHRFTGTSNTDSLLEIVAPFDGFIGDSAQEVGQDVLGITPSGFDFYKVLQELGETIQVTQPTRSNSGLNKEIPDSLKSTLEDINKDKVDVITSVYNELKNEIYFAIPVGEFALYNNYVIVLQRAEGKYRFAVWNNMNPQVWYKANGYVYFIDNRGEIWKMLQEVEDSYTEEAEYLKLAIVDFYDLRGVEDEEVSNKMPATFRITDFQVDIEAPYLEESTDEQNPAEKKFKMFYEYLRRETNGHLIAETNRKLNKEDKEPEEVIKSLFFKEANQLTVGDLGVTDLDIYDARISKRGIKTLNINKSGVVKISNWIHDLSTGLGNMFKIHSAVLTGTPEQER